jgi:hypothetical protein
MSGKNDVGKSNILKALNLFFNNQTDFETPLNFKNDFNKDRLNEVKRESIKGKQFISIKITFIPPKNYINSIPGNFTISKTWNRDSVIPIEKNNIDAIAKTYNLNSNKSKAAERSIAKLLGRTRFIYVPAVKDKAFQSKMLRNLQDILIQSSHTDDLGSAINSLNEKIGVNIKILQSEFEKATNINANINLPEDVGSIFQAFRVNTNAKGIGEIPLTQRGDGIQARFIPSLLYYITKQSNLHHVWGFEEPENSLDYSFIIKLADEFKTTYSDKTQILVTSHSTPFIQLIGANISTFRIYKSGNQTAYNLIYYNGINKDSELSEELYDEMGLFEIQKEYLEKYKISMQENNEIKKQLENISRNYIYVAGETDEKYLNKANEIFGINLNATIKWIGSTDNEGNNKFSGDDALNKASAYILSNLDSFDRKIILLYDSDTNKKDEDHGKLFIRCMPFNEANERFKKGIENTLSLPEDFQFEKYYKTEKRSDSYSCESTIQTLNKTKLCDSLCNEFPQSEQIEIFKNLKSILNNLKHILSNR